MYEIYVNKKKSIEPCNGKQKKSCMLELLMEKEREREGREREAQRNIVHFFRTLHPVHSLMK